jgi:hypothetical protein
MKKDAKELFPCKTKMFGFVIPCTFNGITSTNEESEFGFTFRDSAAGCRFFNEQPSEEPMMEKMLQIKGKDQFTEKADKDWGLRIDPPKDDEEVWMVFKDFDCGNAK